MRRDLRLNRLRMASTRNDESDRAFASSLRSHYMRSASPDAVPKWLIVLAIIFGTTAAILKPYSRSYLLIIAAVLFVVALARHTLVRYSRLVKLIDAFEQHRCPRCGYQLQSEDSPLTPRPPACPECGCPAPLELPPSV